jgi:hypothetical protein
MRKAALLLIIFVSLNGIPLYAQNFKGKSQNLTIQRPEAELRIGETLEYSTEWLGFPTGKIILKIEGTSTINNIECYHISARAIPNRLFRRIRDIEYGIHTYMDKKRLLPYRFVKIRRIKDTYSCIVTEFNQDKNEAVYYYFSPKVSKEMMESPSYSRIPSDNQSFVIKTKTVPEVQDLLSSLYYFRLLNIKESEIRYINIPYGEKNWPVKIKIEKPYIKDLHKKGSFAVIRISPFSNLNDLILGKDRIVVYFTSDSRRIPIEFNLSTAMGSIRGVIQDVPKQ